MNLQKDNILSAKKNIYDYNEALKLLTSVGKFRISLGLERILKILNILDNPQDKLKIIHVAGTNGKGSVCSMIASILNEYGFKVGLYTSPHIFRYTERIKISDSPISDEDFGRYVFGISHLADENNIDLTEFEILTAVMYKYFYDNAVDYAIVEVGLGGRFDATNVVKSPVCSVITHIDYDHTEKLGDTLDKIAFEKAGIMKKDCPCVVLEGREVYYDVADKVGALLEVITPNGESINMLSDFSLNLKGVYQRENLALALAVIEKICSEIDSETIKNGLKNINHPFRFQYFEDKNLIIDGAHNPNGILGLVQSLDTYYPDKNRRFIFGCLKNKDYKQMLNILLSSQKPDVELYFYHFKHQNSAEFDDLQSVCPIKAKELTSDTKIDFNDGKLTVVCGSFYMISEIVNILGIC